MTRYSTTGRDPDSSGAEREVYRSTHYSPDRVVDAYALVNRAFEEGGFRVVEVDAARRTIREYVTQSSDRFTAAELTTMRGRAEANVWPSWTKVSP